MKSLKDIKGIGEVTEKYLNKLGIFEPMDLLYYYPRDYEKFDEIKRIVDINAGDVATIKVMIVNKATTIRKGRFCMTYVVVDDGSRRIRATWFNLPFISKSLTKGKILLLRGKFIFNDKIGLCLNQPRVYKEEDYQKMLGTLTPIYSLTKGISNNLIKQAVSEVIKEYKDKLSDYLPIDIRTERELAEINYAIEHIHFSNNYEELLSAKKRLVYDELFLFSLGLAYFKKKEQIDLKKDLINIDEEKLSTVIKCLPYTLTEDQKKAVDDIISDLKSEKIMNRLIQGDVGSGKTIIAFLSMLAVAFAGKQSMMMAPTEVLARQHYLNLKKIIDDSNLNINICLLTSSTKMKERREILKFLADGTIKIAIGTHSLFNENVVLKNLSLVITDEQHRFGVLQRKSLEDKGQNVNKLVMSATPIPRTLAMLLYADLDISIIKEKPQDRLPIKTAVMNADGRIKVYKAIKKELEKGHQAYIVCTSVEHSEDDFGMMSNCKNVVDYTKEIKEYFDEKTKIEYLHGKMKNSDKENIMNRFYLGEIDILVSTTVIEVGVDCKNATFMMIEDAGHFGLATLHQLRGRVGRGEFQSYTVFIDTTNTEKSTERLKTLVHTNDGFLIAEKDLELRGPGDFFGERQSGTVEFKIADMYGDYNIFKNAAEDAKKLLSNDKDLSNKQNELLKSKLDEYVKTYYTI